MLRVKTHAIYHAIKRTQLRARRSTHRRYRRVQRALMRLRQILQLLQSARAYATRRKVHHSRECSIIVRIVNQAQIRQCVFNLSTLEKPQTAVYAIRNARIEQRMFDQTRTR